ncbi:hypothetical protein P3X46_011943 [Hevea brasiliensis]|nr:hypothetical protein P3X46_011943 [Hevea brasiliensis]
MASNKVMVGLWAFGSVLLFVISSGNTVQGQGITCAQAITTLQPCLPFLLGTASSPNPSCCSGVQTLNKEANTTEIRRQLCQCIKTAAASAGVNPGNAKQLPGLCNVNLPVPIDPSVDCSK